MNKTASLLTTRLEDKPPHAAEDKKKGPKDKPVDEQALNQARMQHLSSVKKGEDLMVAASMRLRF